ncbi:hypothetical protein O6H91_18G036200 [Diphasiastrum complanatum]|uniref:Uncharacterized protein n=1 Tax=Diphasiastrum complanatum TaxID=34168 RepID=A0ACC2B0U4_DIPCM|nr:hypothetical protein O6H91_Y264300 [Diphasiastrum complanatum]KAJ7523067.1 hypothetical protein O6H91_18G036200 [Diphasiastrum complanatum]
MFTRRRAEHKKSSHTSSYADGPPWFFTGRAFYQLHLVKAEIAKRFIPSELKLVQAFGYTLGGFYLANYDSSPAGPFEELVVIAGIVWNPPTSCAWAARVLVNSLDACVHGKKEVGLPSTYAEFLQAGNFPLGSTNSELSVAHKVKPVHVDHDANGLKTGMDDNLTIRRNCALKIVERVGTKRTPLCSISLPKQSLSGSGGSQRWSGPAISMSLPSFSGRTTDQPKLLQYSCDLSCSIVQPAFVMPLDSVPVNKVHVRTESLDDANGDFEVISLLTSRPILAFKFEEMAMKVKNPKVVTS